MCPGTFRRLARSLATAFIFARVRILGTQCLFVSQEVPSEFPVKQKKAAAPHARDRQPALPPKLASACRGNSPLISVNAGSTLYLTMQSFRSNPDLRDLSCPLRHFPSLAQSSEAGSTTRTWKFSPPASSLGCRHSSTFPLQCLSDMHI